MQTIEIFRAGTHVDIDGTERTFTPADLAGMASSYATERHEAPLVVGHPHTDAPAWGWVKALKTVGDRLVAIPDQVPAAFSEAVAAGRYKKVSAAFYAPTDRHNPVPGQWYLRHVGFLGAMPPAIKGLAGVAFAEDDTAAVVIEHGSDHGDPFPPAPLPPEGEGSPPTAPESGDGAAVSPPDSPPPEPTVTPEEAAALKAQNETLQRELAEAHQREAAAARAARTAEHVAYAETLISEARMAEADKARLVALADALDPAEGKPVMFGEGEQATPLFELLKGFLSQLPPRVAFGEQATSARVADGADEGQVAYAENADPERVALDRRIRAHMHTHSVDYSTAARAVTTK